MTFAKIVFVMLTVVIAFPTFASQIQYAPPSAANLQLNLVSRNDDKLEFEAQFNATFGVITNLECYFESSPGIEVYPMQTSITSIKQGESAKYNFAATVTDKSALQNGWIRFRVSYLPDYDKILAYINANHQKYPDEYARSMLLENMQRVADEARHASDNLRYFLK